MARKNLKERQAVGLMLLLWLALVWAHWPLWMLALATPLLVRLLYGAKG
jgi:hypothetical protein